MPQIRRIRFVSLGHDKARMEDLTLEMHDAEGRSTDTALWLDNGGGKSSMLSLFFALLRPAKKDFLGARAEQKLRRLEDYVRPDDHSLVVAEWEMDEVDLFGERQRFVTGVFIERKQGTAEDGNLDHTWFSFREVREQPRLSLERLPVYEDGVEQGKRRWRKAGFDLQMRELRAAAPHAQVFLTGTQGEWTRHLDEQGLDTDLFLYQIRMNQREGGAADLFKFRDVEEFIDFFIRAVLGEEAGEKLAETLLSYRDDLKKRQRYYKPERRLVAGLADRVRQLVDLGEQRAQMLASIRRMAGAADALHGYAGARISAAKDAAAAARVEADSETSLAARLQATSLERRARAVVADHILAAMELRHAEARENEISAEYDRVTRELSIVDLAIPAAKAMRHRDQAESYTDQLEMARAEHAPLLETLRAAATRYAGALLARIQSTDTRLEALGKETETAHALAENKRGEALAQEKIATQNEERARALLREENQATAEMERLVGGGDVEAGESAAAAQGRWESALRRGRQDLHATEERLAAAGEEAAVRAAQIRTRQEDVRAGERALNEQRAAIDHASTERQALESDGLILEALQTDHVNLDQLDDARLGLVARAAEREQTNLFGLWSEEARIKHLLRRLDESGLLPPSRDAEAVVAFLAPHLQMVRTGWEYASRALSVASGEARAFVEAKPHLATGVIVRNEEYEHACTLLAGAALEVDFPVVLAPQRAVHDAGSVDVFVLASSTDAYFDPAAGERERVSRRAELERLQSALAQQSDRRKALEERGNRLASLRSRFPIGHFAHAAEEIERLAERVRHDADRLGQMEEQLELLQEKVGGLNATRDDLRISITRAERAIDRLSTYIRTHGSDPDARQRARAEAEQATAAARTAAGAAQALATEADQAIRARLRDAAGLQEGRGALVHARREITDVDEAALQVVDGDVEALRERYDGLRAQVNRELNEQGIEKLRAKELQEMARAESQYEERARKLLTSDPTSRISSSFLGMTTDDLRAEVDAFTAANPDPGVVGELRDRLVSEQATFRGTMRSTLAEREKATERRDLAAAERGRLARQPLVEPGRDGVPKEPWELSIWVSGEMDTAGTELEESQSHEHRAREAAYRAELADGEAARYGGYLETLAAVVDGTSLLKRACDAPVPAGWMPPEGEAALSARIGALKQELLRMRGDDEALDALRDEVHRSVTQWIEREEFEEVVPGNPMLRDLRAHVPAALEAAAAVLAERLDVRLQTLDRALAAVDEFRDNLISYALNAAEKGVQALEAAQQISRMPAHMPRFGGKHFLKVRHRMPESEDACRERIAALVDEIIASDAKPSGLEMVQRAVRALGRPFRIEVMFPDRTRGAWYTEVERLGRDSGGEVLTSAILLYCNLARLRARSRGRLSSPTSVLFLDNPFGTASRLSFLEVQLEVARAAGVQLVYTTGVKDYDAVSLFPNINRLRPAGYDARHHQWLLERMDVIRHTDGVDMARIVRGSRAGEERVGTAPLEVEAV